MHTLAHRKYCFETMPNKHGINLLFLKQLLNIFQNVLMQGTLSTVILNFISTKSMKYACIRLLEPNLRGIFTQN